MIHFEGMTAFCSKDSEFNYSYILVIYENVNLFNKYEIIGNTKSAF